ncbi:MAG: NUDIX hydrolase [Patescibacteria group bacterium]
MQASRKIHRWKILGSKLAFRHRWYKLRRDSVEIRPGEILNDYFLGIFNNAVHIVALTNNNKIIMVRQYKHGAGKILFEVPAGYLHKKEAPLAAAKRELLEETGYAAKKWRRLGFFYSNPTCEKGNGTYIFLAEGAILVGKQNLDITEAIEVYLFSQDEVIRRITSNKMKVSPSTLALLLGLLKKRKLRIHSTRS